MPDTSYGETIASLDAYRDKLLSQNPAKLAHPFPTAANEPLQSTASKDIIPKAAQVARLKRLALKTEQQLIQTNDAIRDELERGDDQDTNRVEQLTQKAAAHHQMLGYLANVGKEISDSNDPHWQNTFTGLQNPYSSFKSSPEDLKAAAADYSTPEREQERNKY